MSAGALHRFVFTMFLSIGAMSHSPYVSAESSQSPEWMKSVLYPIRYPKVAGLIRRRR